MKSPLPMTVIVLALLFPIGAASSDAAIRPYPVSSTARDGRNDFNFEFGTWRTHYRLLKDRLVGSHAWIDCYGTSIVFPYWDGSGNLEDGDLKCPNRYIGGMTLRMYDARTHQWTIWWGTRALGVAPPPQVGHYDAAGTGDFYAYDRWKGRPVITRFRWTVLRGNPRFEQSYSTDGGKTWEVNWTTDYERVPSSSRGVWNARESAADGHTSFDFLLGAWQIHTRRLARIAGNGRAWIDCNGTTDVRAFWGGGGDVQEGDLHCSDRDIRAVTLRLYDPATHEWRLYWGTQRSGLDPVPQVGRFAANGVGDFFAADTYEGKAGTTRYRWALRNGNPHFEQAFSADGGKTWETNWTSDYTRR